MDYAKEILYRPEILIIGGSLITRMVSREYWRVFNDSRNRDQ